MTLEITTADTPITIDTLSTLIYGQPGNGKTSLAFSSSNPVLLDFDGGAHRSAFRRDTVRVSAWGDIANMTPEDLDGYDTVVIDTVGRALDMLTLAIQEDNKKLRTRAGGLTLQGWGELKAAFAQWIKSVRLMGKDVVMIAHDREEKRGDDTVLRADIQGGSYAEVFKLADGVGYLTINSEGKRVLDFSPSAYHSGKNPAGIDVVEVPNLNAQPNFYGELMQRIKDELGSISEESQEAAKEVAKWRDKIEKVENAEGMNKVLAKVNKIDVLAITRQVKMLMKHRCDKLELTFDDGQFVDPK